MPRCVQVASNRPTIYSKTFLENSQGFPEEWKSQVVKIRMLWNPLCQKVGGDRRLVSLSKPRIWSYQEMWIFHLRCSGRTTTI